MLAHSATPLVADHESLSDRAIGEIRQRIIHGELSSGRSFTEGEVATLLGMSKSPVREALALLRRQGWVDVLPRSGYLVTPMTLRDLRDLFAIRLPLERLAAAGAARRLASAPDGLAELRSYVERHEDTTDSGPDDVPQLLVDHYRFHRRIAVLSGSRELDRTLAEVLLKLQRYLALEPVRPLLAMDPDHAELVEAVTSGKPEHAAEVAAAHVDASRHAVFDILIDTDAVLSVDLAAQRTSF